MIRETKIRWLLVAILAGTASAACSGSGDGDGEQQAAAVCGNGRVETGEDCEPGDSRPCTPPCLAGNTD
jgi:hypothetical protein